MNNNYRDIRDVKFEGVKNKPEREIKFSTIKKGRWAGIFYRIFALILIALVSGGTAGAYIFESKYNKNRYVYPNEIQSSLNNNVTETKTAENISNQIPIVVQNVAPAVVAISNNAQGFTDEQDESSGSGIIFDPNGFIVTSNHVVAGAEKITVKLSSGKTLDATLVGQDPKADIAVIKVEAKNLPAAKFGDSSKMKVGDIAIAIGNPFGKYAGTVTAGIISAVNITINYEGASYNVLQTDAAINSGNSGGALCNKAGEVVGINSLKIPAAQNLKGLGFAIASDEVKSVIQSLMSHGKP